MTPDATSWASRACPAAQLGHKVTMDGQRVRPHGQAPPPRYPAAFHFSSRGQHATGTAADNLTGLRRFAGRAQDASVPGPVVRGGNDRGKVSAVATRLTQGRPGRFPGSLFGVVLF